MRIAGIQIRQSVRFGLGLSLLFLLTAFFFLQIRVFIGQEKAAIALRKEKGRSVEQIFREVEKIRNVAGCDAPVFYITAQPQVVDGIDPSGVAHSALTPCRFQLFRELPPRTSRCSLLIHASHPSFNRKDLGPALFESNNYKLYRCRLP